MYAYPKPITNGFPEDDGSKMLSWYAGLPAGVYLGTELRASFNDVLAADCIEGIMPHRFYRRLVDLGAIRTRNAKGVCFEKPAKIDGQDAEL